MIRKVEKAGKTVEEAIEAALLELGITEDEAVIEIIDEGSKGFLGLGGKDATVIVSAAADDKAALALDFLREVTLRMGMDVNIDITPSEDKLNITMSGENMGILIGRRGDTLDALQYLTSLIVNKGKDNFTKINLDTENYREKRNEALCILARKMAGRVIKTGKNSTLEAMNPNERRIIHAALQDHKSVYTFSIGDEPNRKIVIALKDKKKI